MTSENQPKSVHQGIHGIQLSIDRCRGPVERKENMEAILDFLAGELKSMITDSYRYDSRIENPCFELKQAFVRLEESRLWLSRS